MKKIVFGHRPLGEPFLWGPTIGNQGYISEIAKEAFFKNGDMT